MSSHSRRGPEGKIPSAAVPFVNVGTDGKRKERHNAEVMFVLAALRAAGIKIYNLDHIDDGGRDRSIPVTYRHKTYDIGYINRDGTAFLIEVMRIA